MFYVEREILSLETEKLYPVNQGAQMRSSGISFFSPFLGSVFFYPGFRFSARRLFSCGSMLSWYFNLHVLSVLQF